MKFWSKTCDNRDVWDQAVRWWVSEQ